MPEFQLDFGGRDAFEASKILDQFTQGYVEAMFFTSTGDNDDGDLKTATVAELSVEAWAEIHASCKAFQASQEFLAARKVGRFQNDQAGRDFWYTRNGHGVGFWDRPELYGDHEQELSEYACGFAEQYLYRGDDGRIYLQ